jgi:hypothetical protein
VRYENSATYIKDVQNAELWRIRVKSEESAFVYAIFESHEGILSYSTLDSPPGCLYRDLELQVPVGLKEDAQELLDSLGDLIVRILE